MDINIEKPYVSKEDIDELKKHNINYDKDIKVFLKEIREHFNNVWHKDYHICKELKSLEELNKTYLDNYPSHNGKAILDDSFSTYKKDVLSDNSKGLLGYFYSIYLR